MKIRIRFVLNGIVVALLGVLLFGLFLRLYLLPNLTGPTFGDRPASAQIPLPIGSLPAQPAGLVAQSGAPDGTLQSVGSGFHLRIGDRVLGVMAAHSLGLPLQPDQLESVVLVDPITLLPVSSSQAFWGQPGRSRIFGMDLRVDYALLALDVEPDAVWALLPDARGGPMVGENVVLDSGKLLQADGRRRANGTVYSSDEHGAWVLMEGVPSPTGISGSPFLSEHTGRVVGMALVAVWREQGLFIGMHPVGSLVEHGLQAESRLPMNLGG